jgi:hypothetical protein
MKEERMEKYLELFSSSNDFGGQVLDQLKLIRKFMSLKSLNPELNLIIWDCLKILEYSLRALEWNKEIEKEWKKEIEKLQKNYETTDQGVILPKHLGAYTHNKIYIDFMFLLKMCLDIGIIDRKLSTIQNGEDN